MAHRTAELPALVTLLELVAIDGIVQEIGEVGSEAETIIDAVQRGPGYEFIKNEKYTLLGRVGVGYTEEFGGTYPDGYDQGRVEALVGVDAKWNINATSNFVLSIYYTPSIEDFMAEGRVVTTLAYQADFASYRGLGLKLGLEHDYEFRTPGDDEHNDFKYFANLVWKL